MKAYRAELFNTIKNQLIDKGEKIYLYFIRNGNYHCGELEINNSTPFLKPDNNLQQLFNKVKSRRHVYQQRISAPYLESWENSFDWVQQNLSAGLPVKLNRAASAIFGPLLIPERSAQNYNVYTTFCFKHAEIKNIVDPDKIRLYEAILIDGAAFYTIEDTAKSLPDKNVFRSNQAGINNAGREYINEYIRIKKATIKNFINLDDFNINISPDINLIVGDNNSGKTNLLKILYVTIKSLEEYNMQKKLYGRTYQSILSKKMQEVFQSANEGIGTIVSKGKQGELKAKIELSYLEEQEANSGKEIIEFGFGSRTRKEITEVKISELIQTEYPKDFKTFFIPAKEILSIHEAVKSTFNQYIKGFDGTYFDLVNRIGPYTNEQGLDPDFLRIARYAEGTLMNGRIEYNTRENEFYFFDDSGHQFEMTMTAEGFKQIGIIPVLIRQGLLGPGSILFLDEPDNNLNPPMINKMLEMLKMLVQAGVQVFLTSHNYFVLNRLHIMAKNNTDMDFRLFNLQKPAEMPFTSIDKSDLKNALPENLGILREALHLYEEDIKTDL